MSEKMGRVHWNGWQEFVKKICSIRFVGAVILMAALVCAIATGIDRVMLDCQEWITPWMAPHFLIISILLLFMVLLSVICFRMYRL